MASSRHLFGDHFKISLRSHFVKGTVGSVLREVTAPNSHVELFLYIDTGHLAGYFSKKVFLKNSVLTA